MPSTDCPANLRVLPTSSDCQNRSLPFLKCAQSLLQKKPGLPILVSLLLLLLPIPRPTPFFTLPPLLPIEVVAVVVLPTDATTGVGAVTIADLDSKTHPPAVHQLAVNMARFISHLLFTLFTALHLHGVPLCGLTLLFGLGTIFLSRPNNGAAQHRILKACLAADPLRPILVPSSLNLYLLRPTISSLDMISPHGHGSVVAINLLPFHIFSTQCPFRTRGKTDG